MSALALQILLIAAANAVIASVVVLAAWLAYRKGQPRVAHALCILALIKLVTPPLVQLPVLPAAAAPTELEVTLALQAALAEQQLVELGGSGLASELAADAASVPAVASAWSTALPIALLSAILLGAAFLLVRALARTTRFRRALALASPAPAPLAARLRTLARRMRVERCPDLLVVPARISPMLCVHERRAHVLLPQALLASLSGAELDALLAHELAHASRRDHWIRVLELLVTGLYWWLPTTWWLRRTLRAAEERCCDERVLEALPGQRRAYADALLATLDFLAGTSRAMPPVACGAGAFCDLKTRLTTIMNDSHSRPLSFAARAVLLVGAAAILPIAPTMAQDETKVDDQARKELRAAMNEIKTLRAEMEAMRAELKKDSAAGVHRTHARNNTTDGGVVKIEIGEQQLAEHLAKINENTVDPSVLEHIHKALTQAHDHAAKFDQDKLRAQLAEVHAHATEHAHKALAEAHEHMKHLDHDKIKQHAEQAAREAATYAEALKAHAHNATRYVHEHLSESLAKGGESGRAALEDAMKRYHDHGKDYSEVAQQALAHAHAALERLHAKGLDGGALGGAKGGVHGGAKGGAQSDDDDDGDDDKAAAKSERKAVIDRLRAKTPLEEAGDLLRSANPDPVGLEIRNLRDQVKDLQRQVEKMAQQQAELDRTRARTRDPK